MSENRLLASIKRCNDVKLLRRFINNAKNTIFNDGADLRTANKILSAARDRLWQVRADLENPKDAIERALTTLHFANFHQMSQSQACQPFVLTR